MVGPIMNDQTALVVFIEPPTFNEGCDQIVRVPVPIHHDRDVFVTEATYVAPRAILRHTRPEHFKQSDNASVRLLEPSHQSLELQQIHRANFHVVPPPKNRPCPN
jgi:hypothetical protein